MSIFPDTPAQAEVINQDEEAIDHPTPNDFLASFDRSEADMKTGRVIDAEAVFARARERASMGRA